MKRARLRLLAGTALTILFVAVTAAALMTRHASPGSATSLIATWDDAGVHLSLRVPRGPYFQHELLPVTLTLANHTGKPLSYTGSPRFRQCTIPLFTIRSRNSMQYLYPDYFGVIPSCPWLPVRTHLLAPGRSLVTRADVVLPTAGEERLQVQASLGDNVRVSTFGILLSGRVRDWFHKLAPGIVDVPHRPFASGWPILQLAVVAGTPARRTLHILRRDHTISLRGYPRGSPAPVTRQEVLCDAGSGVGVTGSGDWTPLTGNRLADTGFTTTLGCNGPHSGEKWQVQVGAPGYAITNAVFCFDHGPDALFGGLSGFPTPMGPPCTVQVRS